MPVEKRHNFGSHPKVMDFLRHIALGLIYFTKSAMGLVDREWIAFLWNEADRVEGGLFYGVELFVVT